MKIRTLIKKMWCDVRTRLALAHAIRNTTMLKTHEKLTMYFSLKYGITRKNVILYNTFIRQPQASDLKKYDKTSNRLKVTIEIRSV